MEEMRMRAFRTANGLAVVAMLAAGVAWGQTAPATPCDAKTKANCPAPAAAPPKDTAQQFPFPGEAPATGERPADWGPDAPAPTDPPNAPAGSPNAPPSSSGKSAPPAYPGDPDAPAAGAPKEDGFSSSSSSSSSGAGDPGASPDDGPLKDAGSSGEDTSVRTHRKKLPKAAPQTPEARAAEDLTVADFYQKDGNYLGAYLRAKDAVEIQPNDAYTHFALAEAARKLGKRDEAKEQYAAVLKLDPIPNQMKASQKALAELTAAK
jgi:hypothetical protein